MTAVQKLSLAGQVNAIEFFGVRAQSLRELTIDFLDELR